MLALPTDLQQQQLDSLNALLAELDEALELEATEAEKLKQYVSELPDDHTVKVPAPAEHYPLEKKSKTKDGKGNEQTILDGNRNAIVHSEPELQDGVKGKGIHFNDGFETLSLQNQGLIELMDAFTAVAWIKPDVDQKIQTIMGTSGAKNDFWRGWEFLLDSNNHLQAKLIHSYPHNYLHVASSEQIPVGEWTQVAFTYDGSAKAKGLKLFINGKEADNHIRFDQLYKTIYPVRAGDHEKEDKPIRVGKAYRAFTGEFGIYKGSIDEISLFNQQLSAAEIQQLYHQTLGETPPTWASLPEPLKLEHVRLRKDKDFQTLTAKRQRALEAKMTLMGEIDEVMVMEEMPETRPMYLFARGDYTAPTEEVQPNTPEAVLEFPEDLPRNRLGLAQWLFGDENPLTARVAVNRYWQMLFGKGLVTTPHDFGNQGSLPTHPELLDWLAVDFRESGWDVRALLKKMVMSATYRQRSLTTEEQYRKDRSNLLLARGPSHRLQAEMIRDHALAASGLLVDKVGGPSVKPYQPEGLWIEKGNFSHILLHYKEDSGDSLYRRSMYTFIRRTSPPPMMATFDAPNRDVCTVKRESTNTPLQSLVLMNDPQFVEAARVMAERVQKEGGEKFEERAEYGFRLATGRMPKSKELAVLADLFERSKKRFEAEPFHADSLLSVGEYPLDPQLDKVETAAWAIVTHTLLNHDEFYMKR